MRTKDKQRTLIKGAQVVFPHHVAPADVLVDNGSIALIGTDLLPERYDAAVHDAQGCYLTPGFIDMHVHGGGNCRFGDANKEAVYTVLQMHLQHGTTSIMPTISSYSKETIDASLDALETVRTETPEQPLPEILGVHMEGPYFAAAQQGAQNPAAIRMPDPKEYLSILEHPIPIKRWSAACELPERCNLPATSLSAESWSASDTPMPPSMKCSSLWNTVIVRSHIFIPDVHRYTGLDRGDMPESSRRGCTLTSFGSR